MIAVPAGQCNLIIPAVTRTSEVLPILQGIIHLTGGDIPS